MSSIISKSTIARLLKDVKQIIKEPLTSQGIYYIHSDVDMLKGYALIIGPEDTPYFGGNYFFEFTFPTDYPHSPPKVKYGTNGDRVRFNPNLYICGKVCVSLLNTWSGEQWTSCQTISTVLLTLCTLLCSSPLLNEPGVQRTHADFQAYEAIIAYANLKIAVCGVLERDPQYSYNVGAMESFMPMVLDNFRKNYEKLYEIAKKGRDTVPKKVQQTSLYQMSIEIHYQSVVEKLEELKVTLLSSPAPGVALEQTSGTEQVGEVAETMI